jgi:hypothetical protein
MSDHTTAMAPDAVRTGLGIEAIKRDLLDNLFYIQARFPAVATPNDYYQALSYTVRDRLLERWVRSAQTFRDKAVRTVCYLSAEFMLGPHLAANLLNLGITDSVREAVREMGQDLERLLELEPEPGLGSGGLGRLAACYMESLATMQIPAIGYGIRYEFGIFEQEIRDGWQVERSDKWLLLGNPWEIARPEITFDVQLGGHTEHHTDDRGLLRALDSRAGGARGRLRYPYPRLWRGQREPAPPVDCAGGGVVRFPGFPHGGLLRRGERKNPLRDDLQGSVPQRRAGGRQNPEARAAVFLRLVFPAGHDPHPPSGARQERG